MSNEHLLWIIIVLLCLIGYKQILSAIIMIIDSGFYIGNTIMKFVIAVGLLMIIVFPFSWIIKKVSFVFNVKLGSDQAFAYGFMTLIGILLIISFYESIKRKRFIRKVFPLNNIEDLISNYDFIYKDILKIRARIESDINSEKADNIGLIRALEDVKRLETMMIFRDPGIIPILNDYYAKTV